jgi:hypothetical protein
MPLSEREDWSVYDLGLSSFPPKVQWFREHGVNSRLFRLGFDERVNSRISSREKDIPVSFVGSFFDVHKPRTALLEYLSTRVPLCVWGPAPEGGFKSSSLAKCYKGPAWGAEMFNILARSRMTVNHHGNVPPYANNQRLYEATGVGTLLVTDFKPNLHEMFEPGKEVLAYRSEEECAELIRYYLDHEDEREAVARAGQQRTLREHTYYHRMQELVGIVQERLGRS